MSEQNSEGERRFRDPVAGEEGPGGEVRSHDELTERYVVSAREDTGTRVIARSTRSTDDPGAA